jgi:putative colanic acid biosynthesis acetyltransferase WcaF
MGAKIHPTARIYPSARVWLPANLTMAEHACVGDLTDIYNVAPITIGARSSVFTSDLPAWHLCAGSPAKALRPREFRNEPRV